MESALFSRAWRTVSGTIAAVLTALLVVTGLTVPANAAEADAFTITLSGASESYDGKPVLTGGQSYELAVQYDVTKLVAGEEIIIAVPEGITVPDSALTLGNNDSLDSITRGEDGQLKLKVKDPLPTNIREGAFVLAFVVDEVTESSVAKLTWVFAGTPTTWEAIVKKPGDNFENVNDGRWKGQSSNLSQFVSVVEDVVTIAEGILESPIAYTLTYNTTTAVTPLSIVDTLSEGLQIDAGSFEATLVTWDKDGLNRTAAPVELGATVTSTGFEASLDLPANSELTVKYSAKLTEAGKTALQEKLQEEYDKIGVDGGTYSASFGNSVVWNNETENPSTTTTTVSKTVSGPPGPDLNAITAKSVNPTQVTDAKVANQTSTGADLVTPFDVTYTIKADLTQFAEFEGTITGLNQNVVVRDTLPAQVTFNEDTLKLADQDGTEVTLTKVEAPEGNLETVFAADDYVNQFTVSGNRLWINVGKDTTKNYTISFDATVENLLNSNPEDGLRTITYRVDNSSRLYYGADKYVSRSARTNVVVDKDLSEGLNDPQVFTKSVPSELNVQPAPAENTIPFTFVIGEGRADVTKSQIIDKVDTNVFDVSDLDSIAENGVTVRYNWSDTDNAIGWGEKIDLTSEHWDLSLNDAGELVFSFTEKFAEDLESINWRNDGRLSVVIDLPLKPVIGKQTLEITNNARLEGAKDDVTYLSQASTSATSYGDELEIRKTVYDAVNDAYSNNLRVELDEDGNLTTDEFVYRIEVIPHGFYGNNLFAIRDITDEFPEEVEILGFVNPSDMASVNKASKIDLGGNLEAVRSGEPGAEVVTIKQKEGTRLNASEPIQLYVKVKVTEFTESIGITNMIGNVGATITPTNEFPIRIQKLDSEDSEVVISDPDARFTLTNADGETVRDDITVLDGFLVVPDGEEGYKALTVKNTGVYTLTETVAPAGYSLSDESLTVTVTEEGGTGTLNFFNTPGEDEPAPKTYAIGDYVWIDADKNGLQDDSEALPGVKVELLDWTTGQPVEGVPAQFTDENGRYLFDELPEGEYQVRFTLVEEDHIEKYVWTQNVPGDDSTNNSDGVKTTDPTVAITPKIELNDENAALTKDYTDQPFEATEGVDPTWDAGVIEKTVEPTPEPQPEPKVSVGDYVWIDQNKDGLQDETDTPIKGVKLQILDPSGKPVLDENGDPRTTTTDENGWYEFGDLPVIEDGESYKVVIDPEDPANVEALKGLIPTQPGAGDDPAVDSSTWEASSVRPLNEDGAHDPTLDFGFIRPTVSVGDTVWVDKNRDGKQDEGEPGIPGVVLEVVDEDGNPVTDVYGDPVGKQKTDENGKYSFDNLPAGKKYTVRIVQDDPSTIEALKPYVPTIENGTDDRENDSSTWEATSTDLPNDGDRDPSLDFGFVTKTYAIGDVVWIDSNEDGLQDDDEHTLPGVTVILTDEEGTEIARTKTDEKGLYKFDNLEAGTYKVQFVLTPEQAELYEFTSQDSGDDARDSDADPVTGWTKVIVLDDSNVALTTEYAFGTVEATQGIDPTWDAGVVLKAVDPVDPVVPVDPEDEDTPEVPVGPELGNLAQTGVSTSVMLFTGMALLLMLAGAGLIVVRRKRSLT